MGLRINHNLASLNASLNLSRANSLLSKSLGRLSTGLKINQASDGPADLIVSEKMRSQIRALSQATENTESAISMLSTAEGALNEVNSLLTKVKGLALKAAQSGTQDPDQVAASQAEIDSALQSINSIARNTAFGSKFLLDGSLDIASSEVNTDKINVSVERANFVGATKRMTMNVISAAQKAENSFDLNASGALDASQTIRVVGNRGSSTITFAAGAAGDDIAKEINDQTTQTGVTAAFDSTNKKIVLKSVDYGATEFVTVEDVDGTNNLLRGDLAEQKSKAIATYGTQFKLVAKNGGEAGNKIAFKFNETSSSTAASISITQDASTGGTNVILSLQDKGTSYFGACTWIYEANKAMDTTVSEIKSLIESNATLNGLVSFEVLSGASLTDKITVDSRYTDNFVSLAGGANGTTAAYAALTLSGKACQTFACSTSNSNNITFKSKTAGMGGNDIRIMFSCDGAILSGLALNSLGSAYNNTGSTGYFSVTNGKSQIFVGDNNTIWINGLATFQQIKESIEADSKASKLVDVSFTGSSNANYIVGGANGTAKSQVLAGGAGITGGRAAQAFINLCSGVGAGLLAMAKAHGSAGNGVELIIRNRDDYRENTVDVYGNKVIVNLDVTAQNGVSAFFGDIFCVTGSTCNLGVIANYAGSWANQFNFKVVDDDSLGDNAAISYDTASKTITFTIDKAETTVATLSAAVRNSDAVLDANTGLTFGQAFALKGGNATTCTIDDYGSAFTAANATLQTMYFSVMSAAGSATLGTDSVTVTTAQEIVQLIRQNSLANSLISVDVYMKGTASMSQLYAVALCNLSTNFSTNTFDGAQQVFGDFRYVLTGGYDGNVQTNSVTKTGVNGQVKVNGVDSSAQNLSFTFDNGDIRGTVTVDESFNKSGNSANYTISSKGAFFQVGQKAQISYQTGIALKNISSNALGTGFYLNPDYDTGINESTANKRRVIGTLADLASGSKFDLSKAPSTALDIIEAAIKDVSSLRSQIGAFISNYLESNINSLGVAYENLTASESRIRDVDFAAETAQFTKAQILVQAGTSVAAQANVSTQAALQLLKG